MDDRPSDGRVRRRGRRPYTLSRAEHSQPSYGRQARRENRQGPYLIGFIVVVLGLAVFLYVGLNWVTGPGRAAALASPPTPTPIPVPTPTVAPPTPTPVEQVYIVKAGDNPASIAKQFGIKTEDLMSANNIDDPQKLQIGQTLKIPSPTANH
jgi:hypothetical protein